MCLSATTSNPIYMGDRKMVPLGSICLFHFHLYMTPNGPTHSSLKLLFGQALDLWTPFLYENPGQCSRVLHPLMKL